MKLPPDDRVWWDGKPLVEHPWKLPLHEKIMAAVVVSLLVLISAVIVAQEVGWL